MWSPLMQLLHNAALPLSMQQYEAVVSLQICLCHPSWSVMTKFKLPLQLSHYGSCRQWHCAMECYPFRCNSRTQFCRHGLVFVAAVDPWWGNYKLPLQLSNHRQWYSTMQFYPFDATLGNRFVFVAAVDPWWQNLSCRYNSHIIALAASDTPRCCFTTFDATLGSSCIASDLYLSPQLIRDDEIISCRYNSRITASDTPQCSFTLSMQH